MFFVWLFSEEGVQRKWIQLSIGTEFPIMLIVTPYGIKALYMYSNYWTCGVAISLSQI